MRLAYIGVAYIIIISAAHKNHHGNVIRDKVVTYKSFGGNRVW